MNATRTCMMSSCQNPVLARGLCKTCYGRAYRSGDLDSLPPVRTQKVIHSLSDVDTDSRTAICSVCGPTKIRVRNGKSNECLTRSNERERIRREGNPRKKAISNPEQDLIRWRRSKYGVEPEDFQRMQEESGGKCAICNRTAKLVIDHCHATGAVRGLLCHGCNVALGFFGDNPDRIRNAASYVDGARDSFYAQTGRIL